MPRVLVLDANILMRAVLGKRVDKLLRNHANKVLFVTVEEAFEDARTYLPPVVTKHKGGEEAVEATLEKLVALEALWFEMRNVWRRQLNSSV